MVLSYRIPEVPCRKTLYRYLRAACSCFRRSKRRTMSFGHKNSTRRCKGIGRRIGVWVEDSM